MLYWHWHYKYWLKFNLRNFRKSEEPTSTTFNNSKKYFSSLLRDISRRNMKRIKNFQLTLNSIKNKFDLLTPAVIKNTNISLIIEAKIDNSFPEYPFENDGFTISYKVCRDCHGDCNGEGLLLYIGQNIPSNCSSTLAFLKIRMD